MTEVNITDLSAWCKIDFASSSSNPLTNAYHLYWNGEEVSRYLQVMAYNAEKGFWHDCNHPHGISHVILAWTNKVKPCKFQSFDYLAGGVLVEKGQVR